ncbi:MAG: hypothetical protein AAGE89_09485 [Pseudomonadota bacterium]
MGSRLFAAMMLAGLMSSASALAGPQFTSVYERFNLKNDCPVVEQGERRSTFRCPLKTGPELSLIFSDHGVDVLVEPAHSDGAYFTSEGAYRDGGPYQPSRSGHFGDVFLKDGVFTIEVRRAKESGQFSPFALIYRTTYNQMHGDGWKLRNRLEVLKFGSDHACQIGTVEGSIPEHNKKAAQIADAAFDTNPCGDGSS